MKGIKFAAICAVMAVMVWSLAGCGVPKSEYQKLEQKYDSVQKEIKSFNLQAKKIQLENEALTKTNGDLEKKIQKLSDENKAMEKNNQALIREKKDLQKKLDEPKTTE